VGSIRAPTPAPYQQAHTAVASPRARSNTLSNFRSRTPDFSREEAFSSKKNTYSYTRGREISFSQKVAHGRDRFQEAKEREISFCSFGRWMGHDDPKVENATVEL
jgi:hypothetical protein